jgi:hypothetical protein
MTRSRPTRKSGTLYKSQLQNDLVNLLKSEMTNRRVGYTTLSKLLPNVSRDTIRRALGTKYAKTIDVEFVMRLLHTLGYNIDVVLRKRLPSEMNNAQSQQQPEQLTRRYERHALIQSAPRPDYSTDRVFKVRVNLGRERAVRGASEIRAVVKATARVEHQDHPELEALSNP